jgi:hypothetical protein
MEPLALLPKSSAISGKLDQIGGWARDCTRLVRKKGGGSETKQFWSAAYDGQHEK